MAPGGQVEKLLEYHIEQTDRRFNALDTEIKEVKTLLSQLQEFRIQTIATARTTSLIVGGVTGIFTFLVTLVVTMKFKG